MKEEAAHTLTRVNLHHFFKRSAYKEPIIIVLVINLGSQLSGFTAVSPRPSSGRLVPLTLTHSLKKVVVFADHQLFHQDV